VTFSWSLPGQTRTGVEVDGYGLFCVPNRTAHVPLVSVKPRTRTGVEVDGYVAHEEAVDGQDHSEQPSRGVSCEGAHTPQELHPMRNSVSAAAGCKTARRAYAGSV
jgi:hypothetical protein